MRIAFLFILLVSLCGCDKLKDFPTNKEVYIIKEVPSKERYAIYASSHEAPEILLDKETGRSWRRFRNIDKDGNVKDEGWSILSFDQLGSEGDTPEEADSNYYRTMNMPKK